MAIFDHMHNNPPPPFNPDYDPKAAGRLSMACAQLETEGMYDRVPERKDRIEIIRTRYEQLMEQGQ